MANPSVTSLSERVLSTVNQEILPSIADAIFDGSVLLQRLLAGNVKPWSGGRSMEKAVLIQKSSQGGSFSGLDTFDSSAEENTIRLGFQVKGVEQPVVIPGIEESVNLTPAGQISLLKAKLEEASMNLRDRLTTQLYSDGTGNSSKDINGLDAIVDDGTNAATYGGQTRATYPALNATLVTGVGALTLDHMAAQYRAAASTTGTRSRPTIIVTAEDVWDFYESLLTPTLQYNAPQVAPMQIFAKGPMKPMQMGTNQGFTALSYKGVPVVADEGAPSGEAFFLNEHDLAFYSLKGARLESAPVQGAEVHDDSPYDNAPSVSTVQFMPWQMPENQYGVVGHLIILGNLIGWNPRYHARSTGITG